ncbi:MAG: sulfur carrier protein ThiS [Methylococcaceae bacterium]|jgi:sulfur carrier protein|nr:sulfur carrier protein ThiS [Methylococcaceae bacterium]
MQITINQKPFELPESATLQQALEAFSARPPFAVAVNQSFIHRQHYADTTLQADDQVEIVQPVAGG